MTNSPWFLQCVELELNSDPLWFESNSKGQVLSTRLYGISMMDCVSFMNGKLITFDEKPTINPPDYNLKKISYRVATLVVCDYEKRILYYLTRWPCCSHDTGTTASSTSTKPSYFHPDTTYLLMVSSLGSGRNSINIWHLYVYVKSIQLTLVETRDTVTQWVGDCVILKTYLLNNESPLFAMATKEMLLSFINEYNPHQGINSAGNKLCEKVFSDVIQYLGLSKD
ncbi:hypothetical protein VP01_386g14 [Puccinia sorghi]|uniref:Uncharacterized protein n=1 Tax=Puccinia sorghi TaxID=27349 RepID=A0A0L6UUX4_9BASI|nr:hypothetical protein VP01_386g14 [Puccinia sorghi]